MRRIVSIASILAVLIMLLPTIACAAAPAMTGMGRDCCRQMHGKCGDSAGHGCCEVEVRNDLNQLPASIVVAPVLSLTSFAVVFALPAGVPVDAGHLWRVPEEHSPPGLLLAAITVLRI